MVIKESPESPLINELELVVNKQGYQIVEFNESFLGRKTHFQITLYHPNGFTLDDCASIHVLLDARLEKLTEKTNFSLEISSPGVRRSLKTTRELKVYLGTDVAILTTAGEEWIKGKLNDYQNNHITIQEDTDTIKAFPCEEIRKIVLDN